MPFAKGQSGNPGGRPKVLAEVRELAQLHGPEAIDGLLGIARDAKAPAAARVAAYNGLLDRGYGKPRQALEVGGGFEWLSPEDRERRRDALLAQIRARVAGNRAAVQ